LYFFIIEQFTNMSTPSNNYIMIANFATAIFVTVSVYVHILHNICEEIYITKWMSLILKTRLFTCPTKHDGDTAPQS